MTNVRMKRQSEIPLTLCICIFIVTYFINNDFEIKYLFNYLFVLGFIICSVFVDKRIIINRVTIIYFTLVAIVFIYSFAPNSVMDPESNNHAISTVLFFVCCSMSAPTKKEINRAWQLLIIAASIMTIYIIIIKIKPSIYWSWIYPHLSISTQNQARYLMINYDYGVPIGGSANYADYILAIGLFICTGKLFSGNINNTKQRIWVYLLCICFVLGMIIQNRRSELIATMGAIVIMYSFTLRFRKIKKNRFLRVIFISCGIIVGIFLMYSHGMLDRLVETIRDLSMKNTNGLEKAGNGRLALWRDAFHQFSEKPLLGIGWNQFRANNHIQYMEGINVHNDYLQWLCETGIIGFILLLFPTLILWKEAANRCRILFKGKYENCRVCRSYALFASGIQSFFLILHFMDPCFYKLLFWPIYALSVIIMLASDKYRQFELQPTI